MDAGPQARKLINAIKWIGEGRTQVYRPRADETARRVQEVRATPTRAKRSVPLLLVLLGFLLVGFVAVACLMVLMKQKH